MTEIMLAQSGPLFDGRAATACQDLTEELVTAVATEGKNRLVGRMALTYRHPTPYYWTQVHVVRVTALRARVDDARSGRPMIYGPWLEGTSRRNASSRFKGYRIWAAVRAALPTHIPAVAARVSGPYLARMRGD